MDRASLSSEEMDKSTARHEEPARFVADARLISVLGEQLIGSEKVGILELVKNAYDAAATTCVVTLDGVPGLAPKGRVLREYADLPGPIIEIRDDGVGMNHDDLVNGWLRPATARRARLKERLRREREQARARGTVAEYEALVAQLKGAHGGRLPLGEKGIGRLATHRLGRKLWLRTKTADDLREWELKIDWDVFDSLAESPVDLSSVELSLVHQPPTTEYGPRGSGTVVCSYGGRPGYSWTEEGIIDAGRAISALRSPFKSPAGFLPRFVTPHVSADVLGSPLERAHSPFELTAVVYENGEADLEILFQAPPALTVPLSSFRRERRVDLRASRQKAWRKNGSGLRQPTCGPFIVHIRSWIRMREWMGADYKELIEYLDKFGGLNVYRDGLAALPAELTAHDWLGLSMAQIKKTSNISYYHLFGEIELTQETSLEIRDRSSREGMIETRPYKDLVSLLKAVMDELQFQMQEVRDNWKRRNRGTRVSRGTLRRDLRLLAEVTDRLVHQYDFKKDGLGFAKMFGGRDAPGRLAETTERLRAVVDEVRIQTEERKGLLEAAGFGLAIGVAVHEIGKLAAAIAADVRQWQVAVEGPAETLEVVRSLQRRAEALMGEVQRLAPLRTTRSERAQTFSVRRAIEAARNAFSYSLDEGQILFRTEGKDFSVKGRIGAITQVFANLIDNALYWIGTSATRREIRVIVEDNERRILFADSGPGISEKMKPHLFEPFYSEKSPPSGLGLYICRYYLAQVGATIRPSRDGERIDLPGAQFVLDFAKSPRDGDRD